MNTNTSLSSEVLDKALFGQIKENIVGVYDLMNRCLLQNNVLLLGDTGRCAKDDIPLEGDCIEIGLMKKWITPEVASTLKTFTGVDDPTHDFTYMEGGVPVKVKVITRNYPWFTNPNVKIYHYENVQLPNPFDKYFKARYIIH